MGKKLNAILLSILTTASVIAPPTFAEEAKDYWTYDEMAAFSKVFQSEMEAECEGKDGWCEEMYFHRAYERGGKYQAFINYEVVPMIISSVNPSKKTLSVIYRDDFLQDKLHNRTEETYVKDLFIIRYDVNQKDIAFELEIQNGTIGDKVHQEVVEFESENGEKWLPNNTEVTFKMKDGLFDDTMVNQFWYYFSTTRGNWGHLADVRDCIDEISGKENYECRIVYRANDAAYIPQEVVEPETVAKSEIANNPEETTLQIDESKKGDVVLAPNTGAPTNDKNVVKEMPWWITALIISGGLLLIWWFLPTKFTKTRKKSKKVEKKG